MGGAVANRGAAFVAAVNDNKALFGVGESLDRAENSAAIVGSVARVYINVKRAKAKWAMVA